MERSEVCNYGDDNYLTVAVICIDTIISKLDNDVNNLDTRYKNDGMLLNDSKCQFMIIEPTLTSRDVIEKI